MTICWIDLVLETELDKRQMSYSTLEPGGFVMKGADRKTRLDKRQARIAAVQQGNRMTVMIGRRNWCKKD